MAKDRLIQGHIQARLNGPAVAIRLRHGNITSRLIYTPAGGGPTFGAEYQAVLDNATGRGYGLPSAAWQTKGDQLIKDIGATIWAKLKLFRVYHGPNVDFIRLNWKTPAANLATINNITFVQYAYTKGKGISGSFIDENFIPINEYGSVLASYGANMLTNTSLGNVVAGGNVDSPRWSIYPAGTYYTVNSINLAFIAAPAFPCLAVCDRYAVDSQRQIVNGVQVNNQAGTSNNNGICPSKIYTHARNNAGFDDFNSDYQIDLVYAGDSMSVAEHQTIYNAFQTFKA